MDVLCLGAKISKSKLLLNFGQIGLDTAENEPSEVSENSGVLITSAKGQVPKVLREVGRGAHRPLLAGAGSPPRARAQGPRLRPAACCLTTTENDFRTRNLTKFRLHTAENEPAKNLQNFCKI